MQEAVAETVNEVARDAVSNAKLHLKQAVRHLVQQDIPTPIASAHGHGPATTTSTSTTMEVTVFHTADLQGDLQPTDNLAVTAADPPVPAATASSAAAKASAEKRSVIGADADADAEAEGEGEEVSCDGVDDTAHTIEQAMAVLSSAVGLREAPRTTGGIAYVSGILGKARAELKHDVLYVLCGDMLAGCPIDLGQQGICSMELLNFLNPAVGCIGNHELDYGLPNLLWQEKLANFPLVCANLYVKNTERRVLKSHKTVTLPSGHEIIFIGLVTSDLLKTIKEPEILERVEFRDPLAETIKIARAFQRRSSIIIVLSHLGIEADKKLAAGLTPDVGVRFILGAHSHTIMFSPRIVNGIPIMHVGQGSGQIGKLHFTFDTSTKQLNYDWECVRVNSVTAPIDPQIQELVQGFQLTAIRMNTVLCTLHRELVNYITYPVDSLQVECTMGNFVADIIRDRADVDVVLVASGALSVPRIGPTLTIGVVQVAFPFFHPYRVHHISGFKLKAAFCHWMSRTQLDKVKNSFQVSCGIHAVYNVQSGQLTSFTICGEEVRPEAVYKIAMSEYIYNIRQSLLGIEEELPQDTVASEHLSCAKDILIEVLRDSSGRLPHIQLESRTVFVKTT
ncbi:bifunctional metallophosphatase/5'-nucleotidase [Pelomyxa schiedti]|nr:bifunctional metallophosphatase/5'-nucleotidase [Pelomyxa schiedti]